MVCVECCVDLGLLRYINEDVLHDRSFVIVVDCCYSRGSLDETKEIIGFSIMDQDSTKKSIKMKNADLNLQNRISPRLGILLSACHTHQDAFGA